MAANGNGTISDKSKLTLPLVIMLITATLGAAGWIWSVQAGTQAHCGNADIHHPTQALDGRYVQQPVMEAQFAEVMRRLDRIEGKLDRLQ